MEFLKAENSLHTTLEKALDEIDEKWRTYPGLLIAGSWPGQNDDEFYESNKDRILLAYAGKEPFLGICLGLQMTILAFGGKLENLPENRLGIHPVKGWWGETLESHWHRFYGVEVEGVKGLEDFEVYKTDGIIEAIRAKDHPFFVGVQFHPEINSSKDRPHPILVEFLKICRFYK